MTGVNFLAGYATVEPPGSAPGSVAATIPAGIPAGAQLLLFAVAESPIASVSNLTSGAAWAEQVSGGADLYSSVWSARAGAGDAGSTVTVSAGSGVLYVVVVAYSNTPASGAVAFAVEDTQGTDDGFFPTHTTASGIGQVVAFADFDGATTPTIDSRLSVRTPSGGSLSSRGFVGDAGGYTTATGHTPAYSIGSPGVSVPTTRFIIGLNIGNVPPNAPLLVSPAAGASLDRTVTQRFMWGFSDDNIGDSQSAFDFTYTADGGITEHTIHGVTPNNYIDIASGTFTGTNYQWKVDNTDSTGRVGPYSTYRPFTAANPPTGPTITYPISGGSVQQAEHVAWSVPTQDAFQVQRCADNAGSIDTGTVYFDSGTVTDASNTTRSYPLTFATNSRYEWIRLRSFLAGVPSSWTQIRVDVSYTPPPTPSLSVSADDVGDTITALWSTAAGTGDQPSASYVNIQASADGGTTIEWARSMLLTSATVTFQTPASERQYTFQATAVAANGTTSATGWIGTPPVDGGTTAWGAGPFGSGPWGGTA